MLLPNVIGGEFTAGNYWQRHHPSVYFYTYGVGFVNQILEGIETCWNIGIGGAGFDRTCVKSITSAADLGDDRVSIGFLCVCNQLGDFLRRFETWVEGIHPECAKFGGSGLWGHKCDRP